MIKQRTFLQRLKDEYSSILVFLKTIPNNQRFDFVSKKQLESEDGLYHIKLPLIVHDEDGDITFECCAIGITRKGKRIIIHGKDESGEAENEFMNFTVKDLNLENLAFLADLVKKKL